jgi:hypothetical protein
MENMINSIYLVLFNENDYLELYPEVASRLTQFFVNLLAAISMTIATSYFHSSVPVPFLVVKILLFWIFFSYFPKVFGFFLVSQMEEKSSFAEKESLQYFISISNSIFCIMIPLVIISKPFLDSDFLSFFFFLVLCFVYLAHIQKGLMIIFRLDKNTASKVLVASTALVLMVPLILSSSYSFILFSFAL